MTADAIANPSVIKTIILVAVSAAVPCCAQDSSSDQSKGPVWSRATDIGGVDVELLRPSFEDSFSEPQQADALRKVAGKYPLDRFTRNSIVAPFTLKRENIKNAEGKRVGHRVDLWFVAHGSLDAIRDGDLFAAMIDGGDASEEGSGQALSEEQLQTRGISTEALAPWQLDFYRFGADVIERVWLEGVVKVETNVTDRSHTATISLAEEFAGDSELPNRWWKRKSDSEAAAQYSGLAGYARATRLDGTENQIVVECHLVAYEPTDWFNGPNLLSSKLPLVTQDAVRKFRRALVKLSSSKNQN